MQIARLSYAILLLFIQIANFLLLRPTLLSSFHGRVGQRWGLLQTICLPAASIHMKTDFYKPSFFFSFPSENSVRTERICSIAGKLAHLLKRFQKQMPK